jgi:hypothetical protein
MNITEDQYKAFGGEESLLWKETIKVIQQTQEQLWMQAISSEVKGEDRVHACGQADGVNMIYSLLISLRKEARVLNGLTSEEDLA